MSHSQDHHNGRDTDASEWEPARQLSIREQTPAQLSKEGLGNTWKQYLRIRHRKQLLRDKAKKRTASAATERNGLNAAFRHHLTSEWKEDPGRMVMGAHAKRKHQQPDQPIFARVLWMRHPGKGADQRLTPVKDHQNHLGPGGRGWSHFNYGDPELLSTEKEMFLIWVSIFWLNSVLHKTVEGRKGKRLCICDII